MSAPSIEPAPAFTDEEEVVTEEEEKVAPAAEQAEPIPTQTPAPTTVPIIRDFDIYPEDKVAIERAEADIELNRKGDVLLTVT
ncbi:unnamed protein product, partial [marine sediment metagenome]